MRALRWLIALVVILGTVAYGARAEAAVKWNGLVVEVVETLPSSWPVKASMDWVDLHTGSDMRFVKKCSPRAYRCITIKSGRLTGAKANVAGWAQGSTITIDVWKVENVAAWKKYYGWTTKRWLVAHELGHMFALGHRKTCGTVMDPRTRCGSPAHVPPLALTTAQKGVLARW